MSNKKPPRVDLAAAMEEDLATSPMGPRSSWPQSLRPPSVTPSHGTPVADDHATRAPQDHAPLRHEAHETPRPGSHATQAPADSLAHSPESISAQKEHGPDVPPSHDTSPLATHETERRSDHATQLAPADTRTSRAPSDSHRYYQPPSRIGRKRISTYCSPRVVQQIRTLAAAKDCTIDDLVSEALNLLFAKEGLPNIAFDQKERPSAQDTRSEEGTPLA